MIHLNAWAIGETAELLLAGGGPAIVMGLTSRGVFLRLGQGVVFLSNEPYRGPLTVNLVAGLPPGLEVGAQIAIDVILSDNDVIPSKKGVILSDNDVIPSEKDVILSDSEGSSPPARSAYPRLASEIAWDRAGVNDRLSRMIDLVLASRPHGEASDLLRALLPEAHLVDNQPQMPHETTHETPSEAYSCIRGYIRGRAASDSMLPPGLPDLLPLLGRGEGLTPWGDDLIIGLLLARQALQPDDDFAALAQHLTTAAFSKTSLLSANLIACAARGLADERLLLALRALLGGEPPVEEAAESLLSWGNTSGVAALTGMAIEILRFPRCARNFGAQDDKGS